MLAAFIGIAVQTIQRPRSLYSRHKNARPIQTALPVIWGEFNGAFTSRIRSQIRKQVRTRSPNALDLHNGGLACYVISKKYRPLGRIQ